MRRRDFITVLGGAAAAWPMAAHAQGSRKIPIVSVLWHGTEERDRFYHWFREGFAAVGLKIGTDVVIEDSYADESDARYNTLAPQLVARGPDVLVAITAPPALALAKVHGDIPLVFVYVPDPLGLGLVDGLSKRSQNATGNSSYVRELIPKRVELFKEAIPSLSHLAVLVNPKTRYETERDLAEYRKAAAIYNIVADPLEIAEFDQVPDAFAKLKQAGCDGVTTSTTSIFGLMIKELAEAAISARIPLMGGSGPWTSNGAVLGFGPTFRENFMIGAKYVKKILAGERASDLPVEQPTKFETSVNLKTAKAIGIELPMSLLVRADRVIE